MADSTPLPSSEAPNDAAVEREATRRSRRSFLLLAATGLAGLGGWRWLVSRPTDDGVPWPLRRVLDANGQLAQEYFSNAHLAPVFPKAQARAPRVNGDIGLRSALDAAAWRLRVLGYAPAGPARAQEFTLADIQALPRVEMTTELKCIEGWSVVVSWAGARLSDFLQRYPLATDPRRSGLAPYVSLFTPDEQYYVGLDIESALHPQTLLCYEMNGQPLTPEHGAPLRLVTPLKYGIKHLKRIGTIAFLHQRPADYWAEQGYDWHAGH
ncbi:molybdopterin-dependent oxidoreductase [Hymenobacter wooponensis]|uniref:Molybdopterin-binding oxidoreductase n=1 Tax=Hymenobacter wooponensis TaxID=1525360 RepID=A0A4Z0MTF8_9BACT|nr:molybdopterin-dependent oxidoreductase [Hymenobacter wooponensis]TGD83103.1 molybdopterin-binding oxidoreductase [Hymenobacter wooponensis]